MQQGPKKCNRGKKRGHMMQMCNSGTNVNEMGGTGRSVMGWDGIWHHGLLHVECIL